MKTWDEVVNKEILDSGIDPVYGPEPSLRQMVYRYYREAFHQSEALRCTEGYLSRLNDFMQSEG